METGELGEGKGGGGLNPVASDSGEALESERCEQINDDDSS